MAEGQVASLVKALTGQVAALAAEMGIRLDAAENAPVAIASSPGNPAIATELLRQRAIRADHLPGDLFHEPAWDMLLALYVADADRQAMNIRALAAHTPAPATTAQRWIDHLHRSGLIRRLADPIDRRAVTVSLSDHGRRQLDDYLGRITGR